MRFCEQKALGDGKQSSAIRGGPHKRCSTYLLTRLKIREVKDEKEMLAGD